MKFGWLTLALSPSPEEDATRIDEQLTQACYAEALGFDDIWLTEHYFTGESVYNDPLIFASALAMRTTRVRIGFAVLQMALAFVNRQPFVTSTLIGATTMEQLETNLASVDVRLSGEVLSAIDEVHSTYSNPCP